MKISEIKDMLAETGLPATYSHWTEKDVPPLPYICWQLPNSGNFAADNRVYQQVEQLVIELYTDVRDFAVEKLVTDVLDEHGIVWDRDSNWIANEAMNETDFTADVLIEPKAEEQEDNDGQ